MRRKRTRIVDPRNPRPRLPDPALVAEDPFGPRSVSRQNIVPPLSPRLLVFAAVLVAAFIFLLFNLYQLQVAQGQHFSALAEGNRVREETVVPPRGIIFDRHGKQLVVNQATFAVTVVPFDIPRAPVPRQRELEQLDRLIGIAPVEVERQVKLHHSAPFQPVTLKKNLDQATYQALQENIPQMPGVQVVADTTRHYIDGAALSHILGYVGRIDPQEYKDHRANGYLLDDQIGKTGLEYADERNLRGTDGQQVIETDAEGRLVRTISSTPAVPGNNVYLSVDLDLQKYVVQQLQLQMDEQHKKLPGNHAQAGAAIVENPQTGEIYSMASLPDYDLNKFASGISTADYTALTGDPRLPLLDRATQGQYPPGSTFKPVTGAAALQAGTANGKTSIFCPGFLQRGTTRFGCWLGRGHGAQNMVDAIAHSCDVFFYTVADQMGDALLSKFAKDFGVGRRTGIELGGEARGIAPNADWKKKYFEQAFQETGDPAWKDSYWYEGNTITYGIGQSYLLVTPLQDLQWTATIANGGNYMRPQLAHRVLDQGGAVVKPFTAVTDHKVGVSPESLALLREGLRSAASPGGTSGFVFANHRDIPQPSGKTGTAEYGVPDAKGNFPLHSWFVTYAPSDNPEIAVIVFIEGGGEGHEGALPAAANIMSYYFAHRDQVRGTGN
ncbi:MAG: penicillin-binding protein 2 [Candidatus Dormibacteraeota bacterium]|nr:penicillin-binding protein 2 [Candidatus Dormibacteraeota bacterium]